VRAGPLARGAGRWACSPCCARGLAVPDGARARILAEEDTRRLDRWMERAIAAASVDEALGDGG